VGGPILTLSLNQASEYELDCLLTAASSIYVAQIWCKSCGDCDVRVGRVSPQIGLSCRRTLGLAKHLMRCQSAGRQGRLWAGDVAREFCLVFLQSQQ
jgi:hypothetical protein